MKPYEINELVAEKVMGFEVRDGCIVHDKKRSGIPGYCQKIEYAWEVVEKLIKDGSAVDVLSDNQSINEYKFGYIVEINQTYHHPFNRYSARAETAPLAICKAALLSVGVEVEG